MQSASRHGGAVVAGARYDQQGGHKGRPYGCAHGQWGASRVDSGVDNRARAAMLRSHTEGSLIYTNIAPDADLLARLRAMPKVEIHVHLEGATDAETVWHMAERNGVSLPAASLDAWKSFYTFRDFTHFIDVYQTAGACMRTPEDFAFMTERFLAIQAAQNILYTEAFLSASLLVDKLPTPDLIAAFAEGLRRGEERYGVRCRFIPDIARHQPETQWRVLDFVLAGREAGIFLGLGLGGIEVGYPPELFVDVFAEARRQGLHVVAHAGETDGPASIWGALRSLQAERIGHGVRAVDDPDLVTHLAETQIPLEVNPYSNYRLKVTPESQPHPIRALVDAGVRVTVNSDDPPMFSTDLNQEYALLAAQGFTFDELQRLNLNAVDVCFLPEAEKAELRLKIVDC